MERIMVGTAARIGDQLFAFMAPYGAFDFERRGTLHRAPTVAPVAVEERPLRRQNAGARRRELAAEFPFFLFRREGARYVVELLNDVSTHALPLVSTVVLL